VAAPRPVTNPARRQFVIVRRMQSRPMGPTGAAIANPAPIPFTKIEDSAVMNIECKNFLDLWIGIQRPIMVNFYESS
jgi:hypothetical protein